MSEKCCWEATIDEIEENVARMLSRRRTETDAFVPDEAQKKMILGLLDLVAESARLSGRLMDYPTFARIALLHLQLINLFLTDVPEAASIAETLNKVFLGELSKTFRMTAQGSRTLN